MQIDRKRIIVKTSKEEYYNSYTIVLATRNVVIPSERWYDMKGGIKSSLARSLSTNHSLNQKAIQMRKSWDEVESLLKVVNKPKKK